jgi:hypothetical protein
MESDCQTCESLKRTLAFTLHMGSRLEAKLCQVVSDDQVRCKLAAQVYKAYECRQKLLLEIQEHRDLHHESSGRKPIIADRAVKEPPTETAA